VETRDIRKHEITRWYYIDIRKTLDSNTDREDAIISLPEDKRVRNFRNEILEDYSTGTAEYNRCYFPVCQLFDCAEWRTGYNAHWEYAPDKIKLFDQFERNIIKRFEHNAVQISREF
jgi:hypothetical protein